MVRVGCENIGGEGISAASLFAWKIRAIGSQGRIVQSVFSEGLGRSHYNMSLYSRSCKEDCKEVFLCEKHFGRWSVLTLICKGGLRVECGLLFWAYQPLRIFRKKDCFQRRGWSVESQKGEMTVSTTCDSCKDREEGLCPRTWPAEMEQKIMKVKKVTERGKSDASIWR